MMEVTNGSGGERERVDGGWRNPIFLARQQLQFSSSEALPKAREDTTT